MNNIVNILTQVTVGAFTGYITNTYAIKMLFKEYTIYKDIKIGGVIIKTKDDFIEKISKLVEKDIINYNTLGRELHKEDFVESIGNLVKDFFMEALKDGIKNKKVSDLKSGQQSLEETNKFIKRILEKNIEEAMDIVFDNISLNEILSSEQLSLTLNNLIKIGLNKIEETKSLSVFISAFLKENGNYSLEEIFSPSDKVSFELEKVLEETPELINEIFEIMDKNEVIKNFQESLNNKKISDILLSSSKDNTFNIIKEKLSNYINSSEGSLIINKFSSQILNSLRDTDKSAVDLISKEFTHVLQTYLEKILSFFISKIALWIKNDSQNIERLIQEGIDETVEGIEGMRGMLLAMIKDTLLTDIASKNKISEKIIDFTRDKIDLKEASFEISREIVSFLKNKKIKDIIMSLENNGILSPEIIGEQLKKALLLLLDSADSKMESVIIQKKIGEIYPLDILGIINSEGFKKILLEESSQIINLKLSQLVKQPLKEIIIEENIKRYVDELKLLELNKNENLPLNIEIEDFSQVTLAVKKLIISSKEEFIKEIPDLNLEFYLKEFNKIPNIHEKITQELLKTLHRNLPEILDGQIENLVTENLNKLTPEEVSDVVHDFMGRELEPITKFGGVLGGLAGLALALSGGGSSLTSLAIDPLSLIIYGAVGVLTNVIAIEMIFRPYKEKKFLNKIGLSQISQGYIMKNKQAFGENMGKFVEESLLERAMIKSRFEELKFELADTIKKAISAEDFIVIQRLIRKNKVDMGKKAIEFAYDFLDNNKDKLSNLLSEKVSKTKVGTLLGDDPQIVATFVEDKILKEFNKVLVSEKKLSNMISPEIIAEVKNIIEKKIEEYLEYLKNNNSQTEESLKNIILLEASQANFEEFIERPIFSWVNLGTRERIRESILEKVAKDFLSLENIDRISSFIKDKIEEPINPNHTIGSFLKNGIKEYIENKIPFLMEKGESFILNMIEKNKEDIIFKIQENIYENLNFLQKSGYSLMGGKELVAEVVEHIVSVKLPEYLKDSKIEIEGNFKNILEENIYPIKLKDIQLILKENSLDIFLKDFLILEDTKNNILDMAYFASGEIIENIVQAPLEKYLEVMELNSLENVYEVFKEELNILKVDLLKEAEVHKKDIAQVSSAHILKALNGLATEISIKDLLGNSGTFKNILNIQRETGKVFRNFLIDIYQENLFGEKLENVISKEILTKDIERTLSLIGDNIEIKEYIQSLLNLILQGMEEDRMPYVLPETKKDILDLILLSGLEFLEKNIPDILSAIDFKKITKEEINKMEGKDIHNLFKSFAEKYFTRLKLWGIIGAGFGVHGGISVLATITYIMKRGRNNE